MGTKKEQVTPETPETSKTPGVVETKQPTAEIIKAEQTKLNYWNKVFAYSEKDFKAIKDDIRGRLKSNDWKSTKNSEADKAKANVKIRYQALVGVL